MDGARRKDPLGLIGLWCGIGALVTLPLTLVPLLGCLCLPLGPLGSLAAAGLGIASLVRTGENTPYDGRITAATALLLGLGWWLLLAGIYALAGDDVTKSLGALREAQSQVHGP